VEVVLVAALQGHLMVEADHSDLPVEIVVVAVHLRVVITTVAADMDRIS